MNVPCIRPDWPAPANVIALTTLRPGGESLPPYGSFNLAAHVGDDAAAVLANRADEHDYVPLFKYVPARINAAVKFLQQQKINRIVLAGHSLGASMASHYLATSHNKDIDAFIGIASKYRAVTVFLKHFLQHMSIGR